jgi:hypothetical protein
VAVLYIFVRWEYREITAKIRIELSELGWYPSAPRGDNEKANEERGVFVEARIHSSILSEVALMKAGLVQP